MAITPFVYPIAIALLVAIVTLVLVVAFTGFLLLMGVGLG
jgi:hypothetical protein